MERNKELEISRKIKDLRSARNMTLEQVAKIVGVGKSTVRKWETGTIANMKRDKIAKLAQALGTSPLYLMGWSADEEAETAIAKQKGLSDDEIAVLDLFRKVPEDKRKMVIQMIQVALSTNE